jgi:hypothetical protein
MIHHVTAETELKFHCMLSALLYQLDHKKLLSTKDHVRLVKLFENFVYDATLKFIKGQEEHGGILMERDLLAEAKHELIDLFVYLGYEKLRREEKI